MSVKHTIYDELLQRHQDAIFSYALHMLRNRADAEDVAQEALLRMWNRMGAFNPLKARSWLMRVTHNLCVDVIRRRETAYGREVSAESGVLDTAAAAGDLQDPAHAADQAILRGRIQRAIETLPQPLRSVFVLHELQGMKYAQIADVLGMPLNTVKVYLFRARERLRKELHDYEPSR